MAGPAKKIINLISSDGETFEIDEVAAQESQTIKYMIEEDSILKSIPLPKITSKTLAKVVEYCKRHSETDENGENLSYEALRAFDVDFVKVDQDTLFDLVVAANYLNMKNLIDLSCQAVAEKIKDLSPEEIRATFNIVTNFTPEEEAEIRRENAWAFP